MADYHLVSFKLCPFVQRSVITLEEKGSAYDVEYIDLANKPEWFLKISPFGKVPVLRVDETVLFESAVINEFLDEVAPGGRLHPEDPLRRAHNRAWIEFTSATLFDQYSLAMARDEEAANKAAKSYREKLERLAGQLGDGPYFNGDTFSLVDAATAPLLQRAHFLEKHFAAYRVTEDLPSIRAWSDALLARPSVQRSAVPELEDLFVDAMRNPRDGVPRWLATQ